MVTERRPPMVSEMVEVECQILSANRRGVTVRRGAKTVVLPTNRIEWGWHRKTVRMPADLATTAGLILGT